MTFEEWHESQTHKAYQSLDCPHYAWEKFAWNAALDEAVKVVEDYGMPPFDDVIKKAIKEVKE